MRWSLLFDRAVFVVIGGKMGAEFFLRRLRVRKIPSKELVKEAVDDKKRTLFFVFASDSDQTGTCAMSGLKAFKVQPCKLCGSQAQCPKHGDHRIVAQAGPGVLIKGSQ